MEDIRILLFYCVEGALTGYVGLALLGIRLNLKQFLITGLLQGAVIYIVRNIYTINKIPLGTHTFFILLGLAIILKFVKKTKIGISVIAAGLSMAVVMLSESILIAPAYDFLQLTLDKVLANTWSHIAMGFICDAFLIATALFLAWSKKSLINLTNQ